MKYRIDRNAAGEYRVMRRGRIWPFWWHPKKTNGWGWVFGDGGTYTWSTCDGARTFIANYLASQAAEGREHRWTANVCPVLRDAPGACATAKLAQSAGMTPPCCAKPPSGTEMI